VQPFEVLADPVRRRILEILGPGEVTAGDITRVVAAEFGISQPAVSQHLRVLRDGGLAVVRREGARRFYAVDPEGLAAVARWFGQFAGPFEQPLDALATELARGRRAARRTPAEGPREAQRRTHPA
jgi:DNA-binding transcriptional ArsR family regulator